MNRVLAGLVSVGVLSGVAPLAQGVETTQWYGTVNMAIQSMATDAEWVIDGSPTKNNRVGVKGGVDTSISDVRAIYQFEMGFDTNRFDEKNLPQTFFLRDTWIGVDSKLFGRVRAGSITTRYAETGSMVDLMWGTPGEGRGLLGLMSPLHREATGDTGNEGRLAHSFRYDVPSFYSGFSASILYHLREQAQNNYGLSLQYTYEPVEVFVEHQNIAVDATGHGVSATKLGLRAQLADAFIGFQGEWDSGALSQFQGHAHSAFGSVGYKINNSVISASGGLKVDSGYVDDNGADDGRMGFVLGLMQNLGKSTSGYVQWGMSFPKGESSTRFAALGLRQDF